MLNLNIMVIILWDSEGILLVDCLLEETTINGQYHASFLSQAREAVVQKKRGKLARGVLFFEDNAPVHTARVIEFAEIDHP